jgi:ketosteroid isomerase-like protein
MQMAEVNAELRKFFEAYERANGDSDLAAIAALYADVFLFAGSAGVRSVNKDDFLKVIPKRKAYFASLGLLESKVVSIDETALGAKYIMARTCWRMKLDNSGAQKEIDASATYILERKDGTLAIVMQIDHQDLSARIKDLG